MNEVRTPAHLAQSLRLEWSSDSDAVHTSQPTATGCRLPGRNAPLSPERPQSPRQT